MYDPIKRLRHKANTELENTSKGNKHLKKKEKRKLLLLFLPVCETGGKEMI